MKLLHLENTLNAHNIHDDKSIETMVYFLYYNLLRYKSFS